MDMCLLDRNFQVLPKPASQSSVAVEAFGERLRCSNEDLNTRRDCSKKLALRTVQVHGSDQHHFVAIVFGRTVSHFAMFEREAACGLNVPQSGFMKYIKVLSLKFSEDLPTRFFGCAR